MPWDGDWFGDWDGSWFGAEGGSGGGGGAGAGTTGLIRGAANGERILGNQFRARRRRLYLTGEDDAPPFAALEAYAVRFDGSIAVRQPTRDDIPNQHIFFNGPATARAGSALSGTKTLPTLAAYNDEIEVSNRENVGTKAGDWRLHRGYEGFMAIGPLTGASTVIMVLPWNMCRSVTPGRYSGGIGSGGGCSGGCYCLEGTVFPATLNVTLDISCFAGPIVMTCNIVGILDTTGACGTIDEVGDIDLNNPGDAVTDVVYEGVYDVPTDSGIFTVDYCDPELFDSLYIGDGYTTCTITITVTRFVDVDNCVKQTMSVGFEAVEASGGYVRDAIGVAGLRDDGECLAALTLNACDPFDLSGEGEVDCLIDATACSTATTSYTPCVGATWTVEITE